MKNIYRYMERAVNEVYAAGIPIGKIREVQVNGRARRWGRCTKRPDGTYVIQINACLLMDDVDDMGLMDTLVHEVLHTCDGCMNHGPLWKHYADIMNRKYGYNIKRLNSASEKGLESVRLSRAKYIIRCLDCGEVYTYEREGRAVKLIKRYGFNSGCSCRCGSRRLSLGDMR